MAIDTGNSTSTRFDYRTFLLPQLLVKLGVFQGMRSPNADYRENKFMEGDIAPQNVDQALNFVHPMGVLLNLAGYQLEALTLAAMATNGVSSGVFINCLKGEYSIGSADPSDAENALQYLIQRDFLANTNLCLALRITPRPMWWGESASEQFFSLPVSLTGLGFSHSQLETRNAIWLLLGGSIANSGTNVKLQDVTTGLDNSLTDLTEAIADALTTEWIAKQAIPEARSGLLKYLSPAHWGAMIMGDTILGDEDELETHNLTLINMGLDVSDWLETLNEATFKSWLLDLQKGSFKQSLKQAVSLTGETIQAQVIPEIATSIETIFTGTHPQRDWIKFKHVRDLIESLVLNGSALHYINVLMLMEEMTVIDMLGRIGEPSLPKVTLPFDITGFYEQVPPEDISQGQEQNTFDFHTLQINQAGIYAQGHWQYREQAGLCSDQYNGGRYVRWKHYRFCIDTLPGQDYSAGLEEVFMNVFRWENTNFQSVQPYLKLPGDTTSEDYCNYSLSAQRGTLEIKKIPLLPLDEIVPNTDVYDTSLPDYSVQLEITLGSETLIMKRVHALPYLPQPDLIAAPLNARDSLVIAQRFPLHSYDKVRILAAANYLLTSIGDYAYAFETDSGITDRTTLDALEEIDHNFAEWMARYACVSAITRKLVNAGPQLEAIRAFIMHVLSQRIVVLSDINIDALTVLSVFLHRPINSNLLIYTRTIFGDSLPERSLEIEQAIDDGTAESHIYDWGDNGLGEEGQGKIVDKLITLGIKKTFDAAEAILDFLVKLEKGVIPVAIDVSIFILEITKISPHGTQYPGWAPGEIHSYLGFLAGVAAGFSKGMYFKADSTQRMYASVNWDPGDFSGPIFQLSFQAGVVLDLRADLDFINLHWHVVDVGGWLEQQIQTFGPVQKFADWMGVDPNDIRLGFTLSTTTFVGNTLDLDPKLPIVSRGLNWVDYSYGAAGILEAGALNGAILHISEDLMGHDAYGVLEGMFAAVDPLTWRVMAHTSARTYNELDEWELTDGDKVLLRGMVAEYLIIFRRRDTKLTINGHASPIGSDPYNLWLSQKRAQAAYDYLRSLLTDDEFLILPQNTVVQGFGELYANVFGAPERDETWQTVMIYLNGELVVALGESLSESDAG
ncbi:OmpA family protein [Candidatus Flexifilum breve]|uniref:OmpA family protein n=1 Tax=Candidatus Flexifilum breve TaxID=3140694 RepID=UPI0031CCA796